VPTALTLLFPDGYVSVDGPAAGFVDSVEVLDETSGSTTPFDGTLASAGTLLVRGWAYDPVRGLPGAGVVVTLGGAVTEARYGEPRPDIAAHFGNERLARTGFTATVSPAAGTSGAVALTANVVSADAQAINALPGSRNVLIVPGDVTVSFALPLRPGFATHHIDDWRSLQGRGEAPFSEHLVTVERGTSVRLSGWAMDAGARRPVRGVYLVVDDRDVVRGLCGMRRDDVAASVGAPALATAGFEIRFDTSGLASGVHHLRLGLVTADGTAHDTIELGALLEILPPVRP
jgi:hypothetical protein